FGRRRRLVLRLLFLPAGLRVRSLWSPLRAVRRVGADGRAVSVHAGTEWPIRHPLMFRGGGAARPYPSFLLPAPSPQGRPPRGTRPLYPFRTYRASASPLPA